LLAADHIQQYQKPESEMAEPIKAKCLVIVAGKQIHIVQQPSVRDKDGSNLNSLSCILHRSTVVAAHLLTYPQLADLAASLSAANSARGSHHSSGMPTPSPRAGPKGSDSPLPPDADALKAAKALKRARAKYQQHVDEPDDETGANPGLATSGSKRTLHDDDDTESAGGSESGFDIISESDTDTQLDLVQDQYGRTKEYNFVEILARAKKLGDEKALVVIDKERHLTAYRLMDLKRLYEIVLPDNIK